MMGGTSGLEHLNELYESIIMDHYRNPRHTELIDAPDVDVEANNPFCGDEVHIQLGLDDSEIARVSVSGRGCAISQSSASLLAELIDGKSRQEAHEVVSLVRRMMKGEKLDEREQDKLGDAVALEGVKMFPVRVKCALLSWVALDDALADFEKKLAE